MHGNKVRSIVELFRKEFPDFANSAAEHGFVLDAVENDTFDKEISFHEFISLLEALGGEKRPAIVGDNSINGINGDKIKLNGSLETIEGLKKELLLKSRELNECRNEIEELRRELRHAIARASSNTTASILDKVKDPQHHRGLGSFTSVSNQVKMASYIEKLLTALQILEKDRHELYQLHLQVVQGGKGASKEITRRTGLERQLGQIYNELLDIGDVQLALAPSLDDNRIIMGKGGHFILLAMILWILGMLMVFLVKDYIVQSDFLLRFPSRSIF